MKLVALYMKKLPGLLIVYACMSCADKDEVNDISFEDDIIELNWSYAVKDLYFLEEDTGDYVETAARWPEKKK